MALGRGLGELLGEIETAYEGNNNPSHSDILILDIEKIKPNPYQPRKIFNEEKLQELSDSILTNGLLQPIVVTRDQGQFLLIAGERRLKASKLASLDTIKAIVIDVEDIKLRELALIENIQRDDLNIIEIAYSYAGLVNDYNITHEELAKLVSKSRSSITNTLRLLTLSNFTQKMIGSDKITYGHAKVLVGLSEEDQKIIVESIIGQKLSVRDTEILVKKLKNETVDLKTNNEKNNFDYSLLNNVAAKLKNSNLNAQFDKNYFKIKINSQDDIENIINYFQ
ncbi:MAG: ParB/RepB/Spo0J family partition protein [Campylobacterota bacterium]|nr:ParB/RepB/Spo0J family partition protein [Campylobacterota bacterium]